MATKNLFIMISELESRKQRWVKKKFKGKLFECEDSEKAVEKLIKKIVGKAEIKSVLHINRWSDLGGKRHAQLDVELVDGSCYVANIIED